MMIVGIRCETKGSVNAVALQTMLFVASYFQGVLLCESINCCHFLYEQVHLHCITVQ